MGDFKSNYPRDGLEGVISAAAKIISGVRDDETKDAGTEDKHPIVRGMKTKAAVGESRKADQQSHVVDKEGHSGRLVKRNEDGTVDVNIEGKGVVNMPATTWSAKIRKYDKKESFQPQGKNVKAEVIEHSIFGRGVTMANTQIMEGDEIISCDVLFEDGIETSVPVYEMRVPKNKNSFSMHLKKKKLKKKMDDEDMDMKKDKKDMSEKKMKGDEKDEKDEKDEEDEEMEDGATKKKTKLVSMKKDKMKGRMEKGKKMAEMKDMKKRMKKKMDDEEDEEETDEGEEDTKEKKKTKNKK